jgi:hypothetical protein
MILLDVKRGERIFLDAEEVALYKDDSERNWI